MSLAQQQCVPCEGGVSALSADEATQMLGQTPGWEIIENHRWLKRKFTFSNFAKALAFVNAVGAIAEDKKHHPDITFGWGYCDIRLQTHAIGGLHENDFIVAAAINDIEQPL